ncbi:NYN domain-containing protein [Pyxidicoccus fallax]|uniref:NYN domain-containing protein n=1 Tax=Pyxidicoccus fallax TaxID=394095 RepID=A0A848LMS0_9BACT|nr:NYN domain-containing protein [Pyxidicoccus fallax]NMO18874.1 NYN domain-containing protein [Pyxidicoccus fallax]NPC80519.1 NYN domain-containing protein [Pyxidicoccus fallax]
MNGRTEEHRIALFIDFENLVTNTGISSANFDLQPSLDRLLEKGKVVFRRAYCDWSRFAEAKIRLHDFGVELIDVPPSTRAGKNGADMRLVIDALELCYARESIDTFVIGSGDSDFCPLAYKLRENGRTVIGLAVKESTSPLFVKACDEFIYLRPRQSRSDKDKGDKEKGRHSVAADDAGHGKRGHHGHKASGGKGAKSEAAHAAHAGGKGHAKTEVPEMAREVVQSMLARATGPVNPSLIKEAIVRKEPDFDEREHGFSTFARLLAALEQEGLLRRIQQGRQWYVVAADSDLGAHGETKGKKRHAHAEEEDEELESYPDPDEDEGL